MSLFAKNFILKYTRFKNINNFIYSKRFTSVSQTISVGGRKNVGIWLAGMAGMTFGAVVLGGVTRLTESGLSMTNWHIIKERPPSNEGDWMREFERYKSYPEYKYMVAEHEMSLNHFKFIWYMEYSHRMWGRLIGAAYAIPAAYFFHRGYFDSRMKPRVLVFGGLILFQGLLGWYMVKSGLEPQKDPQAVPRVSQYRLAAHLSAAVALFSLFVWNSLSHLTVPVNFPTSSNKLLGSIRGLTHGLKFLVATTIISGAFVAGLDAGLTYNSWPKMADRWLPTDLWCLSPGWTNLFENPTTVQFNHRLLGSTTGVWALTLWAVCLRHRAVLPTKIIIAANIVAMATMAQISLGISTLLHYVPTSLAAMHQANSLLVLSAALWLGHMLRRMPK